MTEIFISHAHEDAAFVHQLCDSLHARGASFWRYDLDVPLGQDWREEVDAALDDARVLLLVLSPAALRSANVEREWRAALKAHKPIVPVMIQDTLLPRALKNLVYVPFTTQPYAVALERLIDSLKAYRIRFFPTETKPASPPEPAPALPSSNRDWGQCQVIIAIIAIVIGVVVAIAQTFIADWLASDSPTAAIVPSGASENTSPMEAVSPGFVPTPGLPTATFAPIASGTVRYQIARSGEGGSDGLTLIFWDAADLTDFVLATARYEERPITTFSTLRTVGNRVGAGTCLVYQRENTTSIPPRSCAIGRIYEVVIPPADVFWYDDSTNRPLDIMIRRGENIDVCTTSSSSCDLRW